jgi:hypothetical protein
MADCNFTEKELETEIWKLCPDDPRYAVSNLGRIKRIDGHPNSTGKPRSQSLSVNGYMTVNLQFRQTAKSVHRLVCRAFHGDAPDGQNDVNHKDNDRTNNRADNLEWMSRKENLQWAKEQGRNNRGSRNGQATITENDVLRIIHLLKTTQQKHGEIGKQVNASEAVVQSINTGRTWAYLTVNETFPLQRRG